MIGVVINPRAAGNRRRPGRAQRFREIVGQTGEVAATASVAELEDALRRFRERSVKVLAICGGDGSIYHTLAKALEVWGQRAMPQVLLLKAGTINNIARNFVRPGRSAEASLESTVAGLNAGRRPATRPSTLIRVNGGLYGHIVGAGPVARYLELYYRGRWPGPLRAVLLLLVLGMSWILRTALTRELMEPFEAEVECDGRRLGFTSFSILLASTVEHIGLGVRPFYRAKATGGAFHLLAGPATAGQLLGHLPRFMRGKPARLASLYDSSASRVIVRFASPQPLTINGELLDRVTRLELETGPRLELLA